MCGLSGYYHLSSSQDVQEWNGRLQRSVRTMALRGPDDEGFYHAPHVGLGHRRLSIIDVQGGHQPLIDAVTGTVLVYNGELYNFRELRSELHAAGITCHTSSDSEVVLRSYLFWGADCLERFNGMFAMAIYTPSDESLFVARDRLGVKPLFYGDVDGVFCFASTMRAMLQWMPGRPSLNLAAVSHYLSTIRINMGRQTLLDGIFLLEPGYWMRLTAKGERMEKQYWKPPCYASRSKPPLTDRRAQESLMEIMSDAVKCRLISDVPLGGFLSGGLDSSIVSGLAAEHSDHHYDAYSVGYAQDGFNEWPYVRSAAQRFGMNCREIDLDPQDYPDVWSYLIQSGGQPLSTPNEVPIYMLSKALRQDYTVALSGEGADEVFGGYTLPYFAAYDYDRASRRSKPRIKWSMLDQAISRCYGQEYLPDLTTQHLLLNSWLLPGEKRLWLHNDIYAALDEDRAVRSYYDALYAQYPDASTLDRIMQVHLRVNLEGLLMRVDSSSMAASVEVRVPFTDHRLVELAFSLPDRLRLDWRSADAKTVSAALNVQDIVQKNLIDSKVLLRQTFASRIPSSIVQRPKMSFPVPVFDWMDGWMKSFVQEQIASSSLSRDLLNPMAVQAWLSGDMPVHPLKLWPLVNLCMWHEGCFS